MAISLRFLAPAVALLGLASPAEAFFQATGEPEKGAVTLVSVVTRTGPIKEKPPQLLEELRGPRW